MSRRVQRSVQRLLVFILLLSMVALQPAVPAAAGSGDDEFSATTLGSQWHWVRENPSHWSLTANPGYLRLVTTATDLAGATNSTPLLLQSAPSGDFSLTTRIQLSPSQNSQQAGLILYTDDDNFVRLTAGYESGTQVMLGKELSGSYQQDQVAVSWTGAIFLQLDKVGQSVIGYASTDGSSWTFVGQFGNVTFTPSDIGLLAFNGDGSTAPEIAADVDYFHEQDLPCVTATGNDEFSSSTLGSQWSWVREDPTHWSLTDNPGSMRLITQNKDIYQTTNTAPLLLQSAPVGDFDVTTRITMSPTQNYQQGGLIVYNTDDNYFRLAYGYIGGALKFEFGREINATFTSLKASAPAGSSFYLRIRKTGQTFTGAYSVDGSTWTDVGQYANVALTVAKIGLFALNGTQSVPEIPADFDFFHVESFMCTASGGTTSPAVGGTTNVYDALGRLAAVVDPSSETAIYHYDAVGNLLSISRQSSAQVAVIQVTPGSGAVGRTVTIDGTDFSSDPSQDSVSFNGTAATVTAASTTQLTVTVPSGATTGPISVTAPDGSASSPTDFTVTSGQAPTVSGISPSIGASGTIVTITGTNFADLADNVVTFNGTRATVTSASATSLTVTVPPPATAGPITVTTPDGAATSSDDFVIPPSGTSVGSIGTTSRMAIGDSQVVTIDTAGQVGLVLFDGQAGQRISLQLSNETIAAKWIYLFAPDGSRLINGPYDHTGYYISGALTLPMTGTYTILLDPDYGFTGNVTVTLFSVPADPTSTIVPGGAPVDVTTTVPSQNAEVTFDGTANQRVSLTMSNNTYGIAYVSILKPDGSALYNRKLVNSGTVFLDTQTLPTTGTYTIFVDPDTGYTGSMTLTLYDVPPDVTGTITADGPSVGVSTSVPGQNAALTFDGTASQQISLAMSSNTYAIAYVSVLNPDGSALYDRKLVNTGSTSLGPLTLPTTGTYTIVVDPYDSYTGSMTLTLTTSSGFQGSSVVLASLPLSGSTTISDAPSTAPTDATSSSSANNGNGNGNGNGQDETWQPGARNQHGDWQSGRDPNPAPDAAHDPLTAGPGVTALSGQVLLYNEHALKDVTISVDGQSTQTDAHGQFLLTGLTAGHHVLIVDGRSANMPNRAYGVFQIGVDLTANQTTVLGYTIWMPQLDTTHTQTFSSPTTGEVVLTNPEIPGLEVHIPSGSVIKDGAGNVVTNLGITPIPTDLPPFPLPIGVHVPIYFTVQPAGTSILPDGAYIVYPNFTGEAPGARVDFWHYDPQTEGWYIYGKGTVTPDGTQIVPDPDVRIYEFTGAMISGSGSPPSTYPTPGAGSNDGDPVDLGTGLFVLHKTDLVEPDTLPLTLTRTYRPDDNTSRAFGVGASDPYDLYLWTSTPGRYAQADLILPDGEDIHYVRTSGGSDTDYIGAVFTHTATPTIYYQSTIAWNSAEGDWNLTLKDGTVYTFSSYFGGPGQSTLMGIRDRYGNAITLQRANGGYGDITDLRSSNGRWIQLTYDTNDRITQASDNIGRTVLYSYDASGHLATVTDPLNGVTTYSYDSNGRMSAIQDAKQITFLSNTYDANGRVSIQTQADGSTYHFAYTLDANGKVTRTDVTDPNGNVRRVTFNSAGYPLTDTAAYGSSEAQTVTYTRDPTNNQITSVTDALGRESDFGYDSMGDLTSVTRLAGTPDAVTTTMTYDADAFYQLASVEDPLLHTTSFAYDSAGNLVKVTDPNGHQTTLGYNDAGQPTRIVDALGNTTQLQYTLGDLTAAVDPLGHVAMRWVDNAGRPVAVTDPLGNVTRTVYDALNQVTSVTDALGGTTNFGYDANGNLVSLQDANTHTTNWSYNSMDRVATRTDPLGNQESYAYDANGNLTAVTTRGATPDSQGDAYAWGYNYYGQLGDGTTSAEHAPELMQSPRQVIAVASGLYHSLFLARDGTVWAVGRNGSGQLGDNTTIDRSTPVQVSGLTDVVAIAAGGYHSLALKSDGTVWAWGDNTNGQLGDGTTTDRHTPVQVSGLTGISAIAGGAYFSLALKSDGTVWAWGGNLYGQLGDGTIVQRHTPVQVSGLSSVTVTAIAAGSSHSLALASDGSVWSWGLNNNGELGDGTTTNRHTPVQVSGLSGVTVTAIAGGSAHSLALKSDGSVLAWGDNSNGELGDTTTTDRSSPVAVSGLSDITALAAGQKFSLAVKSDGTVWGWGNNLYGQLGDGTIVDRHTPVASSGPSDAVAVAAGAYHSLALAAHLMTSVRYDGLNRPDTITFGDGSTVTYTFDAGNRLTQVADSLNGTISESYDNFDQLTQETTPQGTVNYTYDTAGRRTSMTVAGQSEVDYSYDDANRLIQITQGSATVSFGYDQADHRTTLTLPNGIVVAYGYDNTGNLTGLTYSLSGTTLGDLQYGYDANGQRTQTGGSWARTGLPAAITGNSYNADNQLASWNGATLSYDSRGNLTSDGTTTYAWDARNQLSSLSGPTNASFTYDGFGRRTSTTVNGTTTGYLYDGANLVQELSGGSPSANMLTGLGIDEVFSRTDSSGTSSFLTDALGSTLALADSSGTVQTSYTYDPFGNPSSTGATSSNTQQYTGRENDGTGLQYNRARYYSPTLQRFISADPLGFGGGDVNLYAYVGNDPINATDPSGLQQSGLDPGGLASAVAGRKSHGNGVAGGFAGALPGAAGGTGIGLDLGDTVLAVGAAAGGAALLIVTGVLNSDAPPADLQPGTLQYQVPWPANLPSSGEFPYVPPKNTPRGMVQKNRQGEYVDRDGNRWQWDRVKNEWDVQHPGRGNRPGDYTNVDSNGHVTH